MKKFFTLMALALIAVSANAQSAFEADGGWADTKNVTVVPGDADGKYGYVVISLKNEEAIGGYQFTVEVPEGCTLDSYAADNAMEDGKDYLAHYPCKEQKVGKKTELVNTWTVGLTGTEKANTYLVTAYKSGDTPTDMEPHDMSPLGYLFVVVPDDFESGTIKFTEASLSDPTGAGGDLTTHCEDFEAQLVKVSTDIGTSIEGVKAETLTGKEIFNLSGQRVSKATRGIFIVDGKKVFVK